MDIDEPGGLGQGRGGRGDPGEPVVDVVGHQEQLAGAAQRLRFVVLDPLHLEHAPGRLDLGAAGLAVELFGRDPPPELLGLGLGPIVDPDDRRTYGLIPFVEKHDRLPLAAAGDRRHLPGIDPGGGQGLPETREDRVPVHLGLDLVPIRLEGSQRVVLDGLGQKPAVPVEEGRLDRGGANVEGQIHDARHLSCVCLGSGRLSKRWSRPP